MAISPRLIVALLPLLAACLPALVDDPVVAKPLRYRAIEGDMFAHRVSYPTGRFSPEWYTQARVEDAKLSDKLPAGGYTAAKGAFNLDPARFTELGPLPLNSGQWGAVSGRKNVIVVDPRPNPDQTHVVYVASDGGGVWRSSNCCGPGTTFTPVSDALPETASIAIGDLHLDPNDPNIVYAGTGDLRYGSFSFGTTGVLRSVDRGESWELLGRDVFNKFFIAVDGSSFPQYEAIGKVRVVPGDSQRIVVGSKRGLFFSEDFGANWIGPCAVHGFADQRQDITGLELIGSPGSVRALIAVGVRGHATPVQPDLVRNGGNGIYALDVSVPLTNCPAGSAYSLLSRPDNGWPTGTGQGAGYPANLLGRLEVAVAPLDSNVIYAMSADPATRRVYAVWRTADGGVSWTQTSTVSGIQSPCSSTAQGGGQQMWYDAGLTVSPTDINTVLLSGVDLYRSTNGAASFQNLTCGYASGSVHVDHHARAYIGNDPNRLLIGTDGGVYYSANAQAATPSFASLNASISTIEFYSGDITADFATSSVRGAVGGAQDNGTSTAQWNNEPLTAKEWTARFGGDGIHTRIEPVLGRRWYYSSQNGNFAVTTNGPGSSTETANGAWTSDRKPFLQAIEIYKHGDATTCPPTTGCERVLTGTYRIWESIRGGVRVNVGGSLVSSWYINSPDLTKNTLQDRSHINQFAHAFTDPSVAIVGTNDGNVQYGFDLGQGVANSATWVNVTGGNLVLPNRPIMDVVTDALVPEIGLVAVGGFDQNTPDQPGHVFRVVCTARCASFDWQNKSGNLPNIPVNAIMVNPRYPRQVFAGTDWGVYFTDDIDAPAPRWYRFRNGLPPVMIWDLTVDRGTSTLAAWTRSRGAYVWPLPERGELIFEDGFGQQ